MDHHDEDEANEFSWEESFGFRVGDEKSMRVMVHEGESSALYGSAKLIDLDLKENGVLKFEIQF